MLKMVKYVVVVKDTLNGKDYYLNPVADYLDQLTTDLGVAPKFSSEELAVNAYKLLRSRIPKEYSAGVYAIEEGSLVLKKILCKKV